MTTKISYAIVDNFVAARLVSSETGDRLEALDATGKWRQTISMHDFAMNGRMVDEAEAAAFAKTYAPASAFTDTPTDASESDAE